MLPHFSPFQRGEKNKAKLPQTKHKGHTSFSADPGLRETAAHTWLLLSQLQIPAPQLCPTALPWGREQGMGLGSGTRSGTKTSPDDPLISWSESSGFQQTQHLCLESLGGFRKGLGRPGPPGSPRCPPHDPVGWQHTLRK